MKTIAIFGGSGGLGAHVAARIGRRQPVLIGYHANRDKAEAVLAGLRQGQFPSETRQVDARSPASVHEFIAQASGMGKGLGGVISVTGAPFPMCALTDAGLDEFRAIMETELFGTFNVLKASVNALRPAGGGAVVLFLTTAVLRTMDFDGLNSVPKAAIAMMLRHVARESGKDNIRVNGIAPGVIDAGRTDLVHTLPPLVQQVVADCLSNTPLARLGKPHEVAELAAYLTSDEAAFVNGQIIAVDGGYCA